jgi:signal transduction histidine kinase
MLKTLRSQLIFSHILPSLITIPLMGIILVYFLESQIILPRLENQLADDTVIIVKLLRLQPQIFKDPEVARSLISDLPLNTVTRVMIIDPGGMLLASTEEDNRLGQILPDVGIGTAQGGKIVSHVDFSERMHGNIIDIFAPVIGVNDQIMGIVRLSYRYASVAEQLTGLRQVILLVLTFGTLISAVLGMLLALNINRPVQEVTQAIIDLARGLRTDELPGKGPEELRKLQQAANFLVSRLHELEESRRELLSNLIHELGRPLGGLRISIQVLIDGAKKDPQILDELLDGMHKETSILNRVVDDLYHLHDSLTGNLKLDLQKVNLSEWLPKVLISSREAALKKGLNWRVDIPLNLPILEIDPERMAQAIGNLVSNAIKYTPKGKAIMVAAGFKDRSVWIRVSDTGPGIPLEEQDKIFVPFYRGTQSQRIKQGMGLGLGIARDLVEAHYGKLELESTPGEGSNFTIWLVNTEDVTDAIKVLGERDTQIE